MKFLHRIDEGGTQPHWWLGLAYYDMSARFRGRSDVLVLAPIPLNWVVWGGRRAWFALCSRTRLDSLERLDHWVGSAVRALDKTDNFGNASTATELRASWSKFRGWGKER